MIKYLDEVKKIPYLFKAWGRQVTDRPDEIFLIDVAQNIKFTLKQSDEITGKVYAFLKSKSIGKEDFVHINLPRGATTVLAMLGVLKAGAAFVITEDTYASERIAYIKNDCSCKLTIDSDIWEEILNCEPKKGYEKTDEHDAAFAVYTSGSTGNPKGVLHEYGCFKLLEYSVAWKEDFFKKPIINYGMVAPLNFVASVEIIILHIYELCHLFILPYSIIKNPLKLLQYYKQNEIREGYLPPSYIRVLGIKVKDYLNIVYTGSEPPNGIYVEGVTIVNNYSMSEVPTIISNFILDKKYDAVPIGKIDCGIPFSLIDDKGNQIKDGSMGELCFAVPFTRGYINLPEQTKKDFINGFFHSGDIAHKLPNGNYVLDGRSNDMIKINGNRIEPTEIEGAFKRLTNVDWCAAKAIVEKRRSYVCLYYIQNIDFDEETINKKMQEFLPAYMIPAYYMKIDKIPLKSSGKMDRKALPIPVILNFKKEFVAPRDDIESLLRDSFAKALNISAETISIKDDFYKLGGDSIATMLVVVNSEKLDLNSKDIFKYKTIEKLAALVRERKSNQEDSLDKQMAKELYVPHKLNAMQVKIFDYQLYKVKSTMWNLPVLHCYEKSYDINKIKRALDKVIEAHPTLSCIINFDKNNELVFEYAPEKIPEIEIINITEEDFEDVKKTLIKPFKLIRKPLYRCQLFKTEKYNYLFFDMQHIIGDGTTISILLRDLEKAYFDEKLDKDYYFLELARIERNKEKFLNNKKYFDSKYGGTDWYTIPEPDFKSRDSAGEKWHDILSINEQDLVIAENRYSVTRNVIAIAAGLIALAKYSGKKNVMTNWIFDNRTTKNSLNYVGLMIKTLPVGVHLDKLHSISELLNEVKNQINQGILNCDFDYFTEYESVFNTDFMEVNYLGNVDFDSVGQRLKHKLIVLNQASNTNARLEIDIGTGTNGEITVGGSYVVNIYKDENIQRFRKLFVESFEELVNNKSTDLFA